MSTSIKKLESCKANAARSTGPRTPQGKAASSRNALKHGLSAAQIPLHFQQAYEAHRETLLKTYKPANPAELDVFDQLAHSSFCLDHIRSLELRYLSESHDPFGDERLTKLDRYRARHTRDYTRALKTLRDLQTNRIVLEQQDVLSQTALTQTAPLAQFTRLTKQTDPVFSSDLSEAVIRNITEAIDRVLHPQKVFMSVETPKPR